MDELVRKTDELTDIVKRLLEGADYAWDTEAMTAAADEIERLRAALSTARADALEEAAKVADAKADEWDTEWRRGCKVSSHLEGKSDSADAIAAAIRALIQKEDNNG